MKPIRRLSFGRWTVEVVDNNGTPLVVYETEPPGPLAALLGIYEQGRYPTLRGVIEAREEGYSTSVGFSPTDPAEGDQLDQLEPLWTDLTGEEPGQDTYVIGASFERTNAYIPRAALLKILEAIDEARPLCVHEPRPPHPMDLLEDEALAQEDAFAARNNPDVMPLYAGLVRVGLLDPTRAEEWLQDLDEHRFDLLRSYVMAARELHAYYQSSERAQYVQPLDAPPIIGGPVSVEWFRGRAPVPADDTHPWVWTAFYEAQFRASPIPREGARERFVKVGGRWSRLRWQWETDEAPSLIWAEEGRP